MKRLILALIIVFSVAGISFAAKDKGSSPDSQVNPNLTKDANIPTPPVSGKPADISMPAPPVAQKPPLGPGFEVKENKQNAEKPRADKVPLMPSAVEMEKIQKERPASVTKNASLK